MDPLLEMSYSPATIDAVCGFVRQAADSGQAIYPGGGQTQWDLGLPPTRAGIVLDTRSLDQVIDYPARDMTITVQAGMTVSRLQTVLTAENQRLPIDVPHADRATLGGILATNASGPRRYGCGTLRDYVIGISVVNDEGQEVKAGGRVVKNVAGYDMCKLYVGSFGTLGIITQVTLKLRPLPSAHGLFAFPCHAGELEAVLTQLQSTQTRPMCLELLNSSAAARLLQPLHPSWPSEWSIVVGFEDNPDALRWQVKQLVAELGGRFNPCGALGSCGDATWRMLVDFAGEQTGSLSFKAGVPAAATAAFCLEAARLLEPVSLQAHAGNGVVIGHCLGNDVVGQLKEVREMALAAGGHLVVTRCSEANKNAAFVWGPPREDWPMMRTIKAKLDPKGLFNPGRFVVA